MTWIITEAHTGMTVGDFIKRNLPVSVKMLKYLKYRPGGITVNGEQVTVRRVLFAGDVLSLATEDTERAEKLEPADLPLMILYEDGDIVIPSKPADMPTHPSHDHYRDTVANALAYRYLMMGKPFVFRPVNRLDRNTSGLLLVARNKMTAGALTRAMQEGRIRKVYLAVLDGEMEAETADGVRRIDACLHRTAKSIIVREVCPPDTPDADAAKTEYRVLAVGNGHTLVEARPLTGRTHQLRVHFAYVGHPITGDDLYGTPSTWIPRHALHARSLTFPHPTTGQEMTAVSPLPEDMKRLITTCFPAFWEENGKEFL